MTRFIHDQFAKDYLEELLSSLGEVKSARVVRGEVREIDVWFSPNILDNNPRELLGLLGKMAINPCLFEPFRNPVTATEIRTCLLKLLQVEGEINRQANRQKTNVNDAEIPRLWILTPTASAQLLGGFGAKCSLFTHGNHRYPSITPNRSNSLVKNFRPGKSTSKGDR